MPSVLIKGSTNSFDVFSRLIGNAAHLRGIGGNSNSAKMGLIASRRAMQ